MSALEGGPPTGSCHEPLPPSRYSLPLLAGKPILLPRDREDMLWFWPFEGLARRAGPRCWLHSQPCDLNSCYKIVAWPHVHVAYKEHWSKAGEKRHIKSFHWQQHSSTKTDWDWPVGNSVCRERLLIKESLCASILQLICHIRMYWLLSVSWRIWPDKEYSTVAIFLQNLTLLFYLSCS